MPFVNPHGESVKIAGLYMAAPVVDPMALPAYAAFVAEVELQFRALPVQVVLQRDNPYPTHHDLFADIDERRVLRVMATGEGDHPVLTPTQNNQFRAIHDYWGHYTCNTGFDRHGEYAAWVRHSDTFGLLARRAMTTETRGQTSALIVTGDFQEQKAILLPEWTMRH